MIAYLDASVLARAYLVDEDGHDATRLLLADPRIAWVTGTWTRIEVSGALIRAARSARADQGRLLALLDADLSPDGPVTVLASEQAEVEHAALALARKHAIRAIDAWHLAVASLTLPGIAEPGEEARASRDAGQAAVAELLGLTRI